MRAARLLKKGVRQSFSLICCAQFKLLTFWDGLSGHRRRVVWDFVQTAERTPLWLEFLPACTPELNWSICGRTGNSGPRSYSQRGSIPQPLTSFMGIVETKKRLDASRNCPCPFTTAALLTTGKRLSSSWLTTP